VPVDLAAVVDHAGVGRVAHHAAAKWVRGEEPLAHSPEEARKELAARAVRELLHRVHHLLEHFPALLVVPIEIELPVIQLEQTIAGVGAHAEVRQESVEARAAEDLRNQASVVPPCAPWRIQLVLSRRNGIRRAQFVGTDDLDLFVLNRRGVQRTGQPSIDRSSSLLFLFWAIGIPMTAPHIFAIVCGGTPNCRSSFVMSRASRTANRAPRDLDRAILAFNFHRFRKSRICAALSAIKNPINLGSQALPSGYWGENFSR
jgi:hypothetical protein